MKLVGKEDIDRAKAGLALNHNDENSDIGFTVLQQNSDGTLPMIIPYKYDFIFFDLRIFILTAAISYDRRVCKSLKADLGSAKLEIPEEGLRGSNEDRFTTLFILFDNTYSWLTPKTLRFIALSFNCFYMR